MVSRSKLPALDPLRNTCNIHPNHYMDQRVQNNLTKKKMYNMLRHLHNVKPQEQTHQQTPKRR